MPNSRRLIGVLVLVATSSIAACGQEDGPTSPEPGTMTVRFSPEPFQVSGLTVGLARLRIGDVLVIGNVPPPPPSGPPPPNRPPPSEMPRPERFDLDALSDGTRISFSEYPQGLYSRILFRFDRVSIEGTWNATPFRASLVTFMPYGIDLRSSTPQELGPGRDMTFEVSVDPGIWFANRALDSATVVNGEIVCDDLHNSYIASALTERIAYSFAVR